MPGSSLFAICVQNEIPASRVLRQNVAKCGRGGPRSGEESLVVKTSLRAFVAVVLLAGFPVLVLLVIAGLALLEFFVAQHAIFLAAKLLIVAVPIAFVLFKALLAVERTTDEDEDGVALTPEAQPALWALVRELAADVGTRPPDESTLIPVVNAMGMEKTRWLGLSVVRRRMYIGAQLFAGLRRDQLSALLVPELAHYSNPATRLTGLTYRG